MTRPLLALALVLALASLAGCPRGESARADDAALAALDTSLATWLPLGGAGDRRVQAAWNDGQAVPLHFKQVLEGWERLQGGEAWARMAVLLDHPRRRDVYVLEWLRPAGDRILCARRQVGAIALDLDPPQPVLVAPITSGATWSWTGTVDGRPASAAFRVVAVETRADGEEIARIAQATVVDGLECEGVRVYHRGLGVVEEQGSFPVGEPNRPTDRMRSRRVEPGDETWRSPPPAAGAVEAPKGG